MNKYAILAAIILNVSIEISNDTFRRIYKTANWLDEITVKMINWLLLMEFNWSQMEKKNLQNELQFLYQIHTSLLWHMIIFKKRWSLCLTFCWSIVTVDITLCFSSDSVWPIRKNSTIRSILRCPVRAIATYLI